MTEYRIGIDVGGTFTDLILFDISPIIKRSVCRFVLTLNFCNVKSTTFKKLTVQK